MAPPKPLVSTARVILVAWLAATCPVAGDEQPGQPGDRAADPPIFTDEAPAAGIDFVHFNGMSGELYLPEITGAGAALFDYDGDGDLDAYLVQGSMLGPGKTVEEAVFPPAHPTPPSDRLYRNDSDLVGVPGARAEAVLRFTDVTERAGLQGVATGYGMGVATGDVDGDGRLDLYLANFGSNQLLRNRGDGTFEDVTAASGADDSRWSVASTLVDYDLDGDADLYVVNYTDFSFANHHDCFTPGSGALDYCGPLNYRPVPDRLLLNRGDGTFTDASGTSGVQSVAGNGLGVVAADFDGDGLPDIFVANDAVENFLWMNRGDGTFVEDAVLAGCAVNREGMPEASMGVVAEDVDGDGDEDLFMTHLDHQTNTFYLNDGNGLFQDHTVQTGLGPPSVGATSFGVAPLDYDNDGELDLLVGNGAVVVIEELQKRGDPYPLGQPNQLYRNRGGLRFEEVTERGGPDLGHLEVTRGIAYGDVDGDGDPDALVANNAGPARLLVGRGGDGRHWLGLRLVAGGTDDVGARAELTREAGRSLRRRVRTDGSYASANDPRLHFGLGDDPGVGAATVRWSDGAVRRLTGLPADHYLILYREDDGGAGP